MFLKMIEFLRKKNNTRFTQIQLRILKEISETSEIKGKTIYKIIEDVYNIPKKKRITIYDNLIKLKERNIVNKKPYNNGKCGRPIILWYLTRYGRTWIRHLKQEGILN